MNLENPNTSLERDANSFSDLAAAVVSALKDFVGGLDTLPVSPLETSDRISPRESLPKKVSDPKKVLEQILSIASNGGHQFHSPGYQCYIPTGGLLEPCLAEFIVSVFNRFVGLKEWAPKLNEIEETAVSWLCEIVGLPPGSSGVLTSGGSLANLTAVYSARHHRLPEGETSRGTFYLSTQAHHSLLRAGFISGIPRANIRTIDVDASYKVDTGKLEAQIEKDIEMGFHPFLIVGMAGTTASGAVDDLDA